MKRLFTDKRTRKNCEIYQMLVGKNRDKHLSFHTPGHKIKGWDITELSYSDNLSSPTGCIKKAQEDIAQILGAKKSFILTDGSTSGVLSMLHSAKSLGVKTLAFPVRSHKSVYNACDLLGLIPQPFDTGSLDGKPTAPTVEEVKTALKTADALLLTSPDYYGNIPNLRAIRRLCDEQGKLFLIDGAHGGHLHFDKEIYAGAYADFWVDGVHKSLPAFTQGAVVSARTESYANALEKSVDIFRTTSPSYPIMASVEYAVKYPQNTILAQKTVEFCRKYPDFVTLNSDWTKLCVRVNDGFRIEKQLEREGFYAEFCDGSVIMFYLSPAMKLKQFNALKKRLERLFANETPCDFDNKPRGKRFEISDAAETELLPLNESENKICARTCGLFPPCEPLIVRGEKITQEKLDLLQTADNTFGLTDGKILVIKV